MMKMAIVKNTVIEENPLEEIASAEDEKRFRKRLAVSETSIWSNNGSVNRVMTYSKTKSRNVFPDPGD